MSDLLKLRGQATEATIYEWDGTVESGTQGDEVPLGVLDNVDVVLPEQELSFLRGAGDTEFLAVQKSETEVGVTGEFAAIGDDAIAQLADIDVATSEMDSSAKAALFLADVEYQATNGDTFELQVGPGPLDGSVELSSSRDDFVGTSVSFIMQTVQNYEVIES